MYTTWYDLIGHPDQIQPPYVLYAFWFLVLLPTLLCVALYVARRPGPGGKIFCAVAMFAALGATAGIYRDYASYGALKRLIASGRYQTAEGCLDRFHAGQLVGGRDPKTHELWRVAGYDFEYASGAWGPGYHRTASGTPDSTSRVRVAFTNIEPSGRVILKLETIRHACPSAPDSLP